MLYSEPVESFRWKSNLWGEVASSWFIYNEEVSLLLNPNPNCLVLCSMDAVQDNLCLSVRHDGEEERNISSITKGILRLKNQQTNQPQNLSQAFTNFLQKSMLQTGSSNNNLVLCKFTNPSFYLTNG